MRKYTAVLALVLGVSSVSWAQSWGDYQAAFPLFPCQDGWVACQVDGEEINPDLNGATPADMRLTWFDLEPTASISPFKELSVFSGNDAVAAADAAEEEVEELDAVADAEFEPSAESVAADRAAEDAAMEEAAARAAEQEARREAELAARQRRDAEQAARQVAAEQERLRREAEAAAARAASAAEGEREKLRAEAAAAAKRAEEEAARQREAEAAAAAAVAEDNRRRAAQAEEQRKREAAAAAARAAEEAARQRAAEERARAEREAAERAAAAAAAAAADEARRQEEARAAEEARAKQEAEAAAAAAAAEAAAQAAKSAEDAESRRAAEEKARKMQADAEEAEREAAAARAAEEAAKEENTVAAAAVEDASCDNLVELEPQSMLGALSGGQVSCLEGRLSATSRMTEKDKISRVLMNNAYSAGDKAGWEKLVKRHLEEIDQSDPDMCYRYALQLSRSGASRASGVIKWANVALENRTQWSKDTYVKRVSALYKMRSIAAQNLWKSAASKHEKSPDENTEAKVQKYRNMTKVNAREWYEYDKSAGRDTTKSLQLCTSAAGTKDYCDAD